MALCYTPRSELNFEVTMKLLACFLTCFTITGFAETMATPGLVYNLAYHGKITSPDGCVYEYLNSTPEKVDFKVTSPNPALVEETTIEVGATRARTKYCKADLSVLQSEHSGLGYIPGGAINIVFPIQIKGPRKF